MRQDMILNPSADERERQKNEQCRCPVSLDDIL